LLRLGAEQLGVPAGELELVEGGVRHGASGALKPIPELILARFGSRGATLTTEANYTSTWAPYDKETGKSEKVTEHWFAGAVGVRLALDTATGRIRIEHLAVAGDVGRAINPTLVEQQLSGAAIMGIGHSLFDQLVIDQGQLVNGTLLDYQLPSIRDLPEKLTPIIIESPHDTGPFGAKGVGETGILAVAPAIGNAVRDAAGIRCTRLPLTPESIVAALTEGSSS
jgi:CO/xanthine dehydrogenase Mo-binding subunit